MIVPTYTKELTDTMRPTERLWLSRALPIVNKTMPDWNVVKIYSGKMEFVKILGKTRLGKIKIKTLVIPFK